MEQFLNLLKYLAICRVKMLSYSMKKFWNTIIDGMDQVWDETIEFLGKLNSWIPLSAVLIAGFGLLGVVLVLAICGCILRKRLVPHWLIWTYFTFATIIIFAHTGNNLAAIVEAIEIPVLVVLLCYILLLLFRRRPRYVYVEKEVYARQLAKGCVYQVGADGQIVKEQDKRVKKNQHQEQPAREVEKIEKESTTENETGVHEEKVDAEEVDEIIEHESEMKAAEVAKLAAAEEAARVAREAEKAAERKAAEQAARETFSMPTTEEEPVKQEPVKRVDKTDFLTARTVRPNLTSSTATATVDLPTVNPIPGKSYEPMREPTIVTKPISQTIPGLKVTGSSSSTSRFSTATRPTATTTARTTTFTTTRPTTSTYSSLSSRPTTTTTLNRTTTSTVSKTPTTSTNRSTEDIMAAIERLRNSMKK